MAKNASFDVLIDNICPAVFAVGDDKKKRKGKERKGKERKGKGSYIQVTRCYISAICGVGTPWPIPIKFGKRVAPGNLINMSSFCNKNFRGFRSTGVKIPVFPLTLLVIVTTVLRYRAACDIHT